MKPICAMLKPHAHIQGTEQACSLLCQLRQLSRHGHPQPGNGTLKILRQGGLQVQRLIGTRVSHPQTHCMQQLPGSPRHFDAVDLIARYGVPCMRQVHANLVRPPGPRSATQQARLPAQSAPLHHYLQQCTAQDQSLQALTTPTSSWKLCSTVIN